LGRTLGSIITLAGAVAVNVIPGLGQIASAAILIGTAVAGTIVSRLGQKASKPDLTISSQKQAIPARVRAFGRSRLHAYFALYKAAPDGSVVDTYAFMDGPADAIEQVYLNDDKVAINGGVVQALANKAYQSGKVLAGYTKGAYPNVSFTAVMAKITSYTAKFRGDGVVTGYLIKQPEKEKYYLETYPQGDNVEMSMVGRWSYQYDPRDPSQNIADDPTRPEMWSGGNYIGSWKWTENPVLHLLWFLVWDRGYSYDTRIKPALDFWKNAANICDEAVALKEGGTEPRYRSCVSYAYTSSEKEIIAAIVETFDGWIQERGDGAFVVYAGKVYTPTVIIGPDEIVSANLQNFVEKENSIEQVKVTYISALHDYSEQEATPWGGENGATRIGTMDAATPSYSQNRRLAKRVMDRTNATQRGTITTTLAGRKVRGQRFINLNHTEGGIPFFVGLVEITKVARNFETGGLDFDWIAVDPNIDAWNPATEQGMGAPVGDPVTPDLLTAPTITSASPVYDQSGQDSTGTRISATVEAPQSGADYTWYLRWKKTADSVWNEQRYDDTDPGAGVTLLTSFVPTDESIDLQAEYSNGAGQTSGWSATYTIDTSTDATVPDAATSITQTNWSDTLDLVTDYIPRARSYRWQFFAADGTTLIRTLITSGRTVSYASQQAAVDGARRQYVVKVNGINGAGAGASASTGVLTLPAPPKVTGVTATGGATNAEVDFDIQTGNVAGYSVAYSTAQNFDPLTQGTIQKSLASPTYLQGLAAATFYTKVAAFDAWTDRPDLLNYSDEASFVITQGGGGTGGGGGGGGGGYCPHVDTMVLLANEAKDGPGDQKRAGDMAVGDYVWTQHEKTMAWGAYPVTDVAIVDCDNMYFVQLGNGIHCSSDHQIWLSAWVKASEIGVKSEPGQVVAVNVDEAHTYVTNGVLSHNASSKQLQ